MAGTMAINIDKMEEITRVSDEIRAEIYESINAIRTQINDQTPNWIGEDATSYKNLINTYLDQLYSTTKFINSFTWELKTYVEELKANAQENAEQVSSLA